MVVVMAMMAMMEAEAVAEEAEDEAEDEAVAGCDFLPPTPFAPCPVQHPQCFRKFGPIDNSPARTFLRPDEAWLGAFFEHESCMYPILPNPTQSIQ